MLSDAGEDVVAGDAEALGFNDELLDLATEELGALFAGGVGERGDDVAYSGAGLEEAVADQLSDDFVGGVGVDLELAAEGADGGKGIAGEKLAGDHRLLRGVDDLLEERDAGPEVDAEGNHSCTITHSTASCEDLFPTKFPKWESLKINIEKVAYFSSRKSDRQLTSFHQQSTTHLPSKNHVLHHVFAKTPSKNEANQRQKKLLQKRGRSGEVGGAGEWVGEGQAGAEGLGEIGDVVVEEDAGEDVFRSVDGHGGFEEARVAFQGVVDGDVFEAGVEDGGVEEDEAEVAGGFGGDLVGVDGGAAGHEVDGCDDVVDAEAKEGFADEFGAEFGEVEGAEDGGFGLFSAGR